MGSSERQFIRTCRKLSVARFSVPFSQRKTSCLILFRRISRRRRQYRLISCVFTRCAIFLNTDSPSRSCFSWFIVKVNVMSFSDCKKREKLYSSTNKKISKLLNLTNSFPRAFRASYVFYINLKAPNHKKETFPSLNNQQPIIYFPETIYYRFFVPFQAHITNLLKYSTSTDRAAVASELIAERLREKIMKQFCGCHSH